MPLTDFTKENYRRNRDADIEYRYMHTWGRGTNWESSADIYMRKTDSYRKAAVPYGELSWMLRDDPEVWDGEGGVGGRLKREGHVNTYS